MSGVTIQRSQRWEVPFSADMTDEDVEYLLQMPLFSSGRIDPEQFGTRLPLAGILKNDARLRRCTAGEVIVREGEWGTSAFFLLSGAVRVVIERGKHDLPPEILGHVPRQRKSLLEVLKQYWNQKPEIEQRDLTAYSPETRAAQANAKHPAPVYLQDFSRVIDRYETTRIEAVEFFGEQSALGRTERSATIIADGDCELLEIRWQGIRDIMKKAPWLRTQIDMRFRAYGLTSFLRNSPYFAHLDVPHDASETELERITDLSQLLLNEAELKSFGSYDKVDSFVNLVKKGTASDLEHEPIIAREGDHAEGVYLIRSGIARVSHHYRNGHRTVSYLTPGQAFGVKKVMESWRAGNAVQLTHSLRAVGYLTLIFIPAAVFEKAVLDQLFDQQTGTPLNPDFEVEDYKDKSKQMDAGLMEFLVERRFVNGSATMVIDMDRCTRCDDCVRACAATHDNNPRFLRTGPIYDKYMVANACMHCADPVCMIQCPTGAIHRSRLEGEVVINDLTCIGCSACASNCPYEAIRMVQIRDENGDLVYPTSPQKSPDRSASGQESPASSPQQWQPILKATKCDLCSDQLTGPACQQACPHDALVRLDLGSFDTAAQWFDR